MLVFNRWSVLPDSQRGELERMDKENKDVTLLYIESGAAHLGRKVDEQ